MNCSYRGNSRWSRQTSLKEKDIKIYFATIYQQNVCVFFCHSLRQIILSLWFAQNSLLFIIIMCVSIIIIILFLSENKCMGSLNYMWSCLHKGSNDYSNCMGLVIHSLTCEWGHTSLYNLITFVHTLNICSTSCGCNYKVKAATDQELWVAKLECITEL